MFTQILSLHGRDALDGFRLLEKLKIKMAHRLADIEFLKQCRDEDIILKFVAINHHLNAGKYNRIFRATSFSLVREEIKSKRKDLEALSNKSCMLHIKLANIILTWTYGTLPCQTCHIFR
jgi:hypothetical protein